jgi:hypothetical protein
MVEEHWQPPHATHAVLTRKLLAFIDVPKAERGLADMVRAVVDLLWSLALHPPCIF